MKKLNGNPIFRVYNTLHGTYPFTNFSIEDYEPAFEYAISLKREEIESIINNPDKPSFENTIVALEQAGKHLSLVSGVFFNLLHSNSSDELMKVSERVIPQLSELSTYIILSRPLFDKVKAVYDSKDDLDLSVEDRRLLQNCYDGFVESGALLGEEDKKALEQLSLQLSSLTLTYGQNNLREQNIFKLFVDNQDQISAMPQASLDLAADKALKGGHQSGWLFDLSAPSYFPFMQHCPDSSLRKEMYEAKMSLGAVDNEYCNKQIVLDIVNKRKELANLLGYETYAHMALRHRMAKAPEDVYGLLDKLLEAYKPLAVQETAKISEYAHNNNFVGELQPWDWAYWAEQYKQTYYDLDDEMLRPYFELSSVINGVFSLATRLYGITFRLQPAIPVYHKDVNAYEVLDTDGSYLGVLYTDFFPREGKKSGAWMSNFQEQYQEGQSKDHRPHIVVVMNFTPPTEGKPSLLTAGEVGTFLHEFGHALHGLFSKVKYESLSGTNVSRDFVELPSQLMENWLTEREWLDGFARHYETQDKIPQLLIDKIIKARNFLAGYAACRQLSFGYLDMAWHTLRDALPQDQDIKTFEENAWAKAMVLPSSPPSCVMSTSFGHIFSGGYASGYYGYKWAEVLDADAFACFQEHGIFDKSTADSFRHKILEQGDRQDAADLYRSFRGQDADIQPLLRRTGL
ncbi:M3 family metallopeptidase [Porphyromonas pogonae]|uniref:M3 family metallopeptidase n=1 Tax=Porphyromonas pogonae TaxID=867595 RepID=UPI002E773B9E|nr:M3 family metallopeptidase [Porphyromonas pogonae]